MTSRTPFLRPVRLTMLVGAVAAIALAAASSGGHHARPVLAAAPVTDVIQFRGLGADGSAYSSSGCSGKSFYVSAFEQSQHAAGSGDHFNDNYAYVSYYTWNYCSGYSYSYGSGYAPVDLSGGQQSVRLQGEITLTGYAYPGGPTSVTVPLDLTMTDDGEYSSRGQSTYSYTGPGYAVRYRSVGTSSSAAMTGSFIVNGDDYMAAPDYSYANIYQSNNGQLSMFN